MSKKAWATPRSVSFRSLIQNVRLASPILWYEESSPPPRAAQTPISWKARGNFSGTKANFEIKLRWIVPQFLAHKPVNFASLTDSFFVSFQNYWIFDLKCKHCKHKTAFRTRKVTGTFEKWASAPTPLYKPFKYVPQSRDKVFAPFRSENGCRLCPFCLGIEYGFRGRYERILRFNSKRVICEFEMGFKKSSFFRVLI